MNDYTIVATLTNLVYFVVTVVVVFALLRRFDKMLGASFKEHIWPKLLENPIALGIYLGLRFYAVCVLASAFLR